MNFQRVEAELALNVRSSFVLLPLGLPPTHLKYFYMNISWGSFLTLCITCLVGLGVSKRENYGSTLRVVVGRLVDHAGLAMIPEASIRYQY